MKSITINGKSEQMYEMSDWISSFGDCIPVGGYVEADIAWELINCIPPRHFSRYYFQCGEPHSFVAGRTTYLTMVRALDNPEVWQFLGYCHSGKYEQPTGGIPVV